MKLYGKCGSIRIIDSLAGAVVCIGEPQFRTLGKRRRDNRIAVVLRRDVRLARNKVFDGLVGTAMTVFEFLCFCAFRKSHELVSEADAEHRQFGFEKLFQFGDYSRVIGGIASAVA